MKNLSEKNTKLPDDEPVNYRQQYVNEEPSPPETSFAQRSSLLSDRSVSFDLSSFTVKRVTILSSSSMSMLPKDISEVHVNKTEQAYHPRKGGSILVNAYITQNNT